MDRQFVVAAAQMGPIAKNEPRQSCVARLVDMLREAHARGAKLVVFPELALTTFFPRWMIEDQDELEAWYEDDVPGPATKPLFDAAAVIRSVGWEMDQDEDSLRNLIQIIGVYFASSTCKEFPNFTV